ncbi:DUF6496 domain-containing protein [Siccirubricoccus phaeus]|uniref:DUF6496 domain-containing protein n=1 Tax=Siccirubricoccus phaeus TaxID=2595053 RepID=UPI00165C6B55|nr:DUF6496 domain-containing protein [Siccirubricoccus phaeus]
MAKQSKAQKDTVGRVMHEFKHGELESGSGRKVRNPRQAIAIGLSEAGASNQQSPGRNKENLTRTKAKERRGETAQAQKEGRGAQTRSTKARTTQARSTPGRGGGVQTRAELYQAARKRNIPGRSQMSKAELQDALHQH